MIERKTHLYSIGKTSYKRATKYLTQKQVERIFEASERAYKNGAPLNRFFTIHYDDYAAIKNPQRFVLSLLERTRKWLKYRGLPVAYIYVIENGNIKGLHTHILLHIPANYQRAYKRALKRWLPFEWTRERINVKSVKYPTYGNISPLDSSYGVLRYMCKGIKPNVNIRGIKPSDQGEVFGKRWGVSRNLNNNKLCSE